MQDEDQSAWMADRFDQFSSYLFRCRYSWQWIGLDPNPIRFLLLDSTGFGSTWIWISICFRSIRIEFYWIEKRENNPNPIGLSRLPCTHMSLSPAIAPPARRSSAAAQSSSSRRASLSRRRAELLRPSRVAPGCRAELSRP